MITTKKLKLALIATALTAAPAVFAAEDGGLFVEPGITYQTGESDIDNPSPFEDSTAEVDGFGLLARVGFHINEAFFVAADGRFSMPKYKDSVVNYDTDAQEYNVGVTAGFQMPEIGLRVWGTYLPFGELDPDGTSDLDYKFKEGMGYRVGAGFRVSVVSINLEYQSIDYDKTEIEKAVFFGGSNTDSIKYEGETWIASVSFPLEL